MTRPRTPAETIAASRQRARAALARVIPLDEWIARRHPLPIELEMREYVLGALRRLAGEESMLDRPPPAPILEG